MEMHIPESKSTCIQTQPFKLHTYITTFFSLKYHYFVFYFCRISDIFRDSLALSPLRVGELRALRPAFAALHQLERIFLVLYTRFHAH